MGCQCHVAHNAAHYATKPFERNINFNSEELLVDLYFHLIILRREKNLILEFCNFCNQDFYKILKFPSVR